MTLMLFRRMPAESMSNAELGKRGESRATFYYRLRGFRIRGRNVRVGRGEVDLIVSRGRLLVFVEVKSRRGSDKGAPHEAVDRDKQLQIGRLAAEWSAGRGLEGRELRFDVISLLWNGRRFELEHFPAAFELLAQPGRPWRQR